MLEQSKLLEIIEVLSLIQNHRILLDRSIPLTLNYYLQGRDLLPNATTNAEGIVTIQGAIDLWKEK